MGAKDFSLKGILASSDLGVDVSNLDTAPQVEMIDIDLIDSNEKNFYELRDLKPLADSIAMDGLQQFPIVVTSPDDPKRVQLVSGHRRCAAIRMLVEDPETPREDLRLVPCVRKTYSSPAMAELQLILANSTARVLTPAETSKQAERVEMLLYELKDAGFDFPGRMRDHVAEACNVSASKLARLKVIREKLDPVFMKGFETGELCEASAYELAKLIPSYQTAIFERTKSLNRLYTYDIESIKKKLDIYFGPGLHCKYNQDPKTGSPGYCEHGHVMWEVSKKKDPWSMCGGCCADCYRNDRCEYVCDKCKADLEEKRREYEKTERQREKERAEAKEEREAEAKACKETWLRVAKLCDYVGKDFCEMGENSKYWGCWWDEEDAAECLAGHEDDEEIYDIQVLKTIANECYCSIDYILGRTDYPEPYTGEWRRADDPPEAGTYVWVIINQDNLLPSVFFKGKFMDYTNKSVGNVEIPDVEWWMPIAPLPKGRKFNGESIIQSITGRNTSR